MGLRQAGRLRTMSDDEPADLSLGGLKARDLGNNSDPPIQTSWYWELVRVRNNYFEKSFSRRIDAGLQEYLVLNGEQLYNL